MSPRLSVVIPCYGHWPMTERCLRSLVDALGPALGERVEVVVVDNASPDDTAARLEEWRDRVQAVLLGENRNFAGGNNAGARAARGEVLVFLNNDTVVSPGALEALAETAAAPDVGAAGLRLLYPDGTIQHGGFGWLHEGARVGTVHFFQHDPADTPAACSVYDLRAVTGACLATRRELYLALGGFDESFRNGWEDVDYCLRAGARGLRVVYRGDLALVHDEGRTSGRDYAGDDNERTFVARHGVQPADEELVAGTFGASARCHHRTSGPVRPDGAPIRIAGPLLGLCGAAAEARTLLALAEATGLLPGARALGNGRPGPVLDELAVNRLSVEQERPVAPFALEVLVHGRGPLPDEEAEVVHLGADDGAELDRLPAVWASCEALARRLRGAGIEAEALLPPLPAYEAGAGGEGILAVLPAHDLALCARVAETVRDAAAPVSFLQTVVSPPLAELVAGRPLLAPCVDEAAFAALAGRFDLVVALDPEDAFQRLPLVAALAGAKTVFAGGGPAEEILGSPLALDAALSAPRDPSTRERVLGACGPEASAARLAELYGRALFRRMPSAA